MTALDPVFRAVLDASWRASALLIVVLALRPLLRGRLPARVGFWVWITVAVRLLLPVTLPAAWSPFHLAPPVRPPAAFGILSLDTSRAPAPAGETVVPAAPPASPRPAAGPWSLGWPTPVGRGAAIWAAGVAALSFQPSIKSGRDTARRTAWRGAATAAGSATLKRLIPRGGEKAFFAWFSRTSAMIRPGSKSPTTHSIMLLGW